MFKKRIEKPMDTTTATTTKTTTKSKKFPTMFKKIMFSRLKNISKDATSAVKSSVQKKTSSKKKTSTPVKTEHKIVKDGDKQPNRPGTATLNESPPKPPNEPLLEDGAETKSPAIAITETKSPAIAIKRPVVQQFNSRTYRVKTKDRKSVLSLPEVSKNTLRNRKSHLPVKVKPIAPAPPVQSRVQKTPSNDDKENAVTAVTTITVSKNQTPEEEYRPDKWVPTAVGSARKKRLVLCYLCGKEFGTASLPFHEPQCLKKWTQENSRLPEHLKRIIPQRPETPNNISVDDWNRLAWETTQSNLVPCEYCQRKFLANRLEAHARVCIESKKKPTTALKLPVKSITADGPKKKPTPCYVCGRLFGTASIGIHEPQCLIKWTRENDSLAPHLRRPVPTKPETIVDEATGMVDHRAMREEHWKTYLSQLVPCDLCKRTFDPDRLKVHQKSCRKMMNK